MIPVILTSFQILPVQMAIIVASATQTWTSAVIQAKFLIQVSLECTYMYVSVCGWNLIHIHIHSGGLILCIIYSTDPLLLELTVSQMENTITELQETTRSLMVRVTQLEGLHQSVKRLERALMYGPTSYSSWQLPPLSQFDQMAYPDDASPFLPPSSPTISPFHPSNPASSSVAPQNPTTLYSPSSVVPQSSPGLYPSQGPPQCVQIKPNQTGKTQYFPSACINTTLLFKPDTTLRKYPSLRGRSKAGALAVKLAREAFFGEEVLAQCTVSGLRQLPALPLAELNQLKQTMFAQFPEFWSNPIEFESVWAACSDAINQACKHVRSNLQKKSSL